jgi:hypothetical protein
LSDFEKSVLEMYGRGMSAPFLYSHLKGGMAGSELLSLWWGKKIILKYLRLNKGIEFPVEEK